MANYGRLDTMIRAVARSAGDKKIAICPFAEDGMMAKQILNLRYGIEEDYIVDNRLSDINPRIIGVEDLKSQDCSNLVVLLVVKNKAINQILENQILSLGKNIEICNILKPAVMHTPHKEDYFKELKELLCIKKVKNIPFVRLGKDYDGGYVMADDFNPSGKAYSFGISNDVSWDTDMAHKGYDVYMYDHTIYELPEENGRFHFFKTGISGKDEPDNQLLSMKTIISNNNDENNQDLILKMDVEGAEWDFIVETPSEILNQFRQISFELHRLPDDNNKKLVVESLNKTHQLVWIHANNYGHIEEANGIEIPAYVEVLYLNKSIYEFEDDICEFPLDIDMPDDPNIEEYVFGNWGAIS